MLRFFLQELKEAVKLVLMCLAALWILLYAIFFGYLAYAWASYHLQSSEPLTTAEIDVLEAQIEKRLESEDYWLVEHTYWVDLFAQSFYAYGRANRYERRPSEESKKSLVKTLERTYANIDTVQKASMRNVGPTRMEGGVIFQWHRLHVLALLAKYRGDEATKKLLLEDTDALAEFLKKAPNRTEESYPGWAWWVDNVDAYASLKLADGLFGTNKHSALIAEWIAEIKKHEDHTGNVLAEAYGPYVAENQSRSSASAWLIPYFMSLDPEYAKSQMMSVDKAFSSTLMGMPVLNEVPVGDAYVNSVPTWPVIFSASSAWTLLSLAAYNATWMAEKSESLERTVRAAFLYDREDGEVFLWVSALLDSALYWSLSFRD